jgi:hypothetical protein
LKFADFKQKQKGFSEKKGVDYTRAGLSWGLQAGPSAHRGRVKKKKGLTRGSHLSATH